MKPEVTLKYLSYLRNKKNNGQEGFTLIELLVVVIIIGVLAAVALPNLLSQVGKARETEIKNATGTTLRSLQSYHFERQNFTTDLGNLGISFQTRYITNVASMITTATSALAEVTPENSNATNDGTRAYSGRIDYGSGTYAQAVCQSDVVTVSIAAPTSGSATTCTGGVIIR
ncbi:MAG: prepilin-type N-terminal cleavage/methylation domain-containing protein, partial [Cyanobacteria bacterium J149]